MPKLIALVMENWPVSKKMFHTITKNPLLISKSLSGPTSLDVLRAEHIVTVPISNLKDIPKDRVEWIIKREGHGLRASLS